MSPTILPTVRRTPAGSLTGRHVLAAMVTFFGVVFAVNGVLLWQAIATHGGLVANEPYRKGLEYNRRIEADERQQAMGWTETVTIERSAGVAVMLSDRSGQPVTGLVLAGTLGRPTTLRHDMALRFEEEAPGRYVAAVAVLDAGAWLLSAAARTGGEPDGASDAPIYRLKRRLWLKP